MHIFFFFFFVWKKEARIFLYEKFLILKTSEHKMGVKCDRIK